MDIESEDYLGRRALHKAVSNNQLAMAEMLLSGGADVNAQDHQGYIPLTTVCSTDDADEDMVKLLLEHKADAELQTKVGGLDSLTALMCAVRGGMEDIVRLLLEAGANPNAPLPTPLQHRTARLPGIWDWPSVLTLLLGHSAEINVQDIEGTTALNGGGSAGLPESVKLLLERGADAEI